jgi:hypothetical protein
VWWLEVQMSLSHVQLGHVEVDVRRAPAHAHIGHRSFQGTPPSSRTATLSRRRRSGWCLTACCRHTRRVSGAW